MKKLIVFNIFLFCIAVLVPLHSYSANVTHKVKQGDNLYNLSKKYHVSVDQLKALNNLRSNKLSLGQTIVIRTDSPNSSANTDSGKKKSGKKKKEKERVEETVAVQNDGEFIEYKVRKGDTLDKIALRFEIDKEDLAEANNLHNTQKKLSPGKVLLIPRITDDGDEDYVTLVQKSLKPWKNSDEKYMLVKVAKSFMGAPYRYGGESVRGLDCSAYVKKIYEIFDVQLPRSAREQFKVGARVEKETLAVGDLVFFKTKRYVKYPTHVGIYIGDGNFIHSSSYHSKLGVKIDSLSSDYYSRTYIGATRVKRPSDDNSEAISTSDKAPNKS